MLLVHSCKCMHHLSTLNSLICLFLLASGSYRKIISSHFPAVFTSMLYWSYHSSVFLSLLLQLSLHSDVFALSQGVHSFLFDIFHWFIQAWCWFCQKVSMAIGLISLFNLVIYVLAQFHLVYWRLGLLYIWPLFFLLLFSLRLRTNYWDYSTFKLLFWYFGPDLFKGRIGNLRQFCIWYQYFCSKIPDSIHFNSDA
jgi:hypothetical protein